MNRSRTATALATAVLLTTVSAGAATAQSPVSVSTGFADAHGHVLEVKDLAGGDLTALALRPGQPQTFRVGVRTSAPTDLDLAPQALEGYTVESSMTHLYGTENGTVDPSLPRIDSSDVDLSYATSALEVRDVLADVRPDYVLSATGIDCAGIAAATGLTLLDLVTSPTCTLLGTLTGGMDIASVPVAGSAIEQLDLSGLLPEQLPLVPRGGVDRGAFVEPDCQAAVASADADCGTATRGTQHTMLEAAPAPTVSPALLDRVVAAAPVPLTSLDGTGARTELADVISALQLSTDGQVADFANRLVQDFTPAQQVAVVNDLMSMGDPLLDQVTDILGTGALANAFPSLQVTPSDATEGTYSGTLTLRLIECPSCP